MRKLIYAIGVTLFLVFLAFHITTSLTNPYFGMSVEALAQGSGSGGSGDDGDCPGGSCSYTKYRPFTDPPEIVSTCTACCPLTKDPNCDQYGCECQ